MGREIRKVPADWQHPTDDRRQGYQPLFNQSFAEAAAEWKAEFAKWEAGERPAYCTGESPSLADVCLVPQLYNADRWGVEYADCKRIRACAENPAFQDARPEVVAR